MVGFQVYLDPQIGGWPPLVVSFQHYYDKEAILDRWVLGQGLTIQAGHQECRYPRADMLERSGILITEDMSRTVREQVSRTVREQEQQGQYEEYEK